MKKWLLMLMPVMLVSVANAAKVANGATSQSDIIYLYDVCQVVQVGDKSAAYN